LVSHTKRGTYIEDENNENRVLRRKFRPKSGRRLAKTA
jgi:hypothetical protein